MTITPVRYDELGQGDFGWLKARYHFSFARYRNPERTGFGDLRVINDDIVKPGAGFDMHDHANMEIITYVRSGAITHEDSLGNKGKTEAGDVQVMSAGSGIRHAEYNREDVPTTLYQIWIKPNEENVAPRWETAEFPKDPLEDKMRLLVSGNPAHKKRDDVLFIHADAALYAGRLEPKTTLTQSVSRRGYLLVSDGEIYLESVRLEKGDGAEITDREAITLTARNTSAELLLIDLPR